jgi:hypothetical protein
MDVNGPSSPGVGLSFEFTCTAAPVQAEGTVAGHSFYFRSRGDTWQFTEAEREGDDPSELADEDVAEGAAWYRSGTLPGRFDASWMPIQKARTLISYCARAYIDEKRTR